MVRETAYDDVFDSQKHYRSILDSMARPGKINRLDPVRLTPPPALNHASVMAGLTLMDADVTFHCFHDEHEEVSYLAANTRAVHAPADSANFLFAHGSDGAEVLESADCGTLTYPDTSATLILQVKSFSHEPLAGSLKLSLEGPGIDGRRTVFVHGLNPDLLLALVARNAEFPLGIDTLLTFSDESGAPCVAGLPRTTRVGWEIC